jgi:hypothetical protein
MFVLSQLQMFDAKAAKCVEKSIHLNCGRRNKSLFLAKGVRERFITAGELVWVWE